MLNVCLVHIHVQLFIEIESACIHRSDTTHCIFSFGVSKVSRTIGGRPAVSRRWSDGGRSAVGGGSTVSGGSADSRRSAVAPWSASEQVGNRKDEQDDFWTTNHIKQTYFYYMYFVEEPIPVE